MIIQKATLEAQTINICDKGVVKIMVVKYHADIERLIISRGADCDKTPNKAQGSFIREWEENKAKSVKSFLLTRSN